jgi:hypothetical protein
LWWYYIGNASIKKATASVAKDTTAGESLCSSTSHQVPQDTLASFDQEASNTPSNDRHIFNLHSGYHQLSETTLENIFFTVGTAIVAFIVYYFPNVLLWNFPETNNTFPPFPIAPYSNASTESYRTASIMMA